MSVDVDTSAADFAWGKPVTLFVVVLNWVEELKTKINSLRLVRQR